MTEHCPSPVLTEPAPTAPPRKLPVFRILAAILIVGLWGTMMFGLWQRESNRLGWGLRRMNLSEDLLLVTFAGYEHWMDIEQNGQRLGSTHLSIMPEDIDVAGDYLMENRTRVSFKMLGMQIPFDLFTAIRMNGAFELKTLQAALLLPGNRIDLQGFTEDGRFYFRYIAKPIEPGSIDDQIAAEFGGKGRMASMALGASIGELQDRCGSVAIERPIFLRDVLLPLMTGAEKFEKGLVRHTEVTNPLTGEFQMPVTIEVKELDTIEIDGESMEAWRLVEQIGDQQSQIWYDEMGNLLRREWQGGIRMERTGAQEVRGEDRGFTFQPVLPELDRDYIHEHQEMELDELPIQEMLSQTGML